MKLDFSSNKMNFLNETLYLVYAQYAQRHNWTHLYGFSYDMLAWHANEAIF